MDDSFLKDCLRTLHTHVDNTDNEGYTSIPKDVKLALMGEQQVIISPVKLPPSTKDVRKWLKEREPGGQRMLKREDAAKNENGESSEVKLPNTLNEETFRKPPEGHTDSPVSRNSTGLIHSPKFAEYPTPNLREISVPTQDEIVSQKISRDVLIGPQHSTPLGNPGLKSRKFLHCTPIACEETNASSSGCTSKQDVEEKFCDEEKCSKIDNLRRNILHSHGKVS